MGVRTAPVLTLRPTDHFSSSAIDVFDAMRAASPPRSAELEGCGVDLYGEEAMAAQYRAWQTKHPSALESFEKLAMAARGKQVAVFLDYDGTLSPIVEDPESAFMSEGMRAAVKNVAALFPAAIISGRGREKVYDFVQLSELYYAGSHGLDIMGPPRSSSPSSSSPSPPATSAMAYPPPPTSNPGGEMEAEAERVYLQPAKEFVPIMNEVSRKIRERAASIPGTSVENNKFCVSVHFRRVDEQKWEMLARVVKDVVRDYPDLRLSHGRKVLEIRPELEWDKGKAVAYLLDALGLDDVLPLYIGDDRTDEDAFDVLNQRGNGYGILVSRVAKNTQASFSLQDTSEVKDFLQRLVDWKLGQTSPSSPNAAGGRDGFVDRCCRHSSSSSKKVSAMHPHSAL